MRVKVYDGVNIDVICDFCNRIYTNSPDIGGLVFQSKGVCPDCAPRFLESVRKHNEGHFITYMPEPGETFHELIMRARRGNNEFTITTVEPLPLHWPNDIGRKVIHHKLCGTEGDRIGIIRDIAQDGSSAVVEFENDAMEMLYAKWLEWPPKSKEN